MRKASAFDPRQEMCRADFEILHRRDSYLKDVELHHHDCFEVFFLISGDVRYTIESRVYHVMPGDLLLISPKELHQNCIKPEMSAYERYVLWVDMQMLERCSTALTDLTRNLDSQQRQGNLLRLRPEERAQVQKLFEQLCVAPVDAVMDEVTFDVTPEIYGYGFDIPAVQKLIDEAEYGQTIKVQLGFIMPDITAKDLTENLFLDTLSSYASINSGSNSDNRNINLMLSCDAINGYVIKAGEEFSFNQVVGRPTAAKGYQKAPGFLGGKETDIVGGGIDQTASTLYYCALMADLEILERHNNGYAVSYIGLGLDASIDWGSQDLRLRNNTSSPIRITAIADENQVYIQLQGIDEKDYEVKLSSETVKQYDPQTIYQVMDKDNVLGNQDGDVLQAGITGYEVELYINRHHKQTGDLISSTLVDSSSYSKRDQIVVRIESDAPVTQPTDPSDVTEPSEGNIITDILDFFDGVL